jgi:hypothetical protein
MSPTADVNARPDWFMQVVAEARTLDKRIGTLERFCASEDFLSLAADEMNDLKTQLLHMEAYHDVLRRRINREQNRVQR